VTRLPRDVLAVTVLGVAYVLGGTGHPRAGALLTLAAAGAHLTYLAVSPSPRVLFPPVFGRWRWVLGAWALALILARQLDQASPLVRAIPLFATGAMVFHYGCICVHEGVARVGELRWVTFRRWEQPRRYFLATGVVVLAGVSLLLAPMLVWS